MKENEIAYTEELVSNHTEARVVVFTGIVHPTSGLQMSATVRADSLEEAWDRLGTFMLDKIADGWISAPNRDGIAALNEYRNRAAKKAVAAAKEAAGQDAPDDAGPEYEGPPPAKAGPPPAKAGPAPSGDTKGGTNPLYKVFVNDRGQVEFTLAGMKWPLKDARGPEIVAGLFDPDLGWKPEHFKPGAIYETEVTGLVVDWEKKTKYYDVLRVHKG
jgi:hypothetical protein